MHVVTPNKRLGSGPLSDYRAAMAEMRAGRGMLFGEVGARLSCQRPPRCRRVNLAHKPRNPESREARTRLSC